MKIRILTALLIFFGICNSVHSQTWVDSLDSYSREKFLPANKYHWTWQNAALLSTIIDQYEHTQGDSKQLYLDYVTTAMNKTLKRANGKRPNAVASGQGMAFLYRVTGEKKYLEAAQKIFVDYTKIPRTYNGGVSHLLNSPELWDDTVFMIGIYFLEMYKATGDLKYLDELVAQIRIHRDVLRDTKWGLWVHGWDGNNKNHCVLCGQRDWPDKVTRRSGEIWGRGNGWIIVTLSKILQAIPADNKYYPELAGYLKEMVVNLPELQDKSTGHWLQLPVRTEEPGNYIESSCTAMFAYGILQALQLGIIQGDAYSNSVNMAYKGIRAHSIKETESGYLSTKNVCKGTCIGDKAYYLNRKSNAEKPSGFATFMLFGFNYERSMGKR